MKRKILKAAGSILFIYVLIVGMMYFMQRNMMYVSGAEKPQISESGVIGQTEITVETKDGLTLFGWYKPPYPPQKPTIVWFHGNASNVSITTERAIPYLKDGFGLLAVEYRGYAGNPGYPAERGLYADARGFIEWLIKSGTPENNIIVYGESIGTGPAVQMATEYGGLNTLILESPFTSMIDVASFHYPYLPVQWLLKDRFENISKIKDIQSPLIVVYGDKDEVIPHRLGEEIFKAAPEPKSRIIIEGGDHNTLDDYNTAEKIISLLSE